MLTEFSLELKIFENTKLMQNIHDLTKLVRYYILKSTTVAGSGHPTSSLSAADIMSVLMFDGYFRADLEKPNYENNDRLIFSKGHAAPLFYSLYTVAGKVTEQELLTLRLLNSRLEGHPTMKFPYTEAATGSLGQGLSIGLGMALNAKLEGLDYKTYVLMGDSEMAEGSVWEAMQIASHYKVDNLVGIIDVNRLGQRGETMQGHNLDDYKAKCEAFGWETFVIDGHNLAEIKETFEKVVKSGKTAPKMIVAKTLKGGGISFLADKEGWHGKALKQDEFEKAVLELGEVNTEMVGVVASPTKVSSKNDSNYTKTEVTKYTSGEKVATRKAYGNALVNLGKVNENIVVLDAETSNSTFADGFKKLYPQRFFEMYIAEQNMAGAALGFSRRNHIPFISTFAAFFSRAYDQIRMSQYSSSNIKFVGSHAGVSIGEDGSSQMALEDIAMFRAVSDMVVFYPSDAISCERLVYKAAEHKGNVYIRTTRAETNVIYSENEEFEIGGSKTIKSSETDMVTIIAAGITLSESLKAYEELQKSNINARIVDLYSVKPADKNTLIKAAQETKALVVVEDHYKEGGLFSSVVEALALALDIKATPIYSLAVNKMPMSGKPQELLEYEQIDAKAIVELVKKIV